MTNDEICELVAEVKKMENELMLDLSSHQLDWLYDLFGHCEKKRFEKFSENAIKFLENIRKGFYTTFN